MFIAALNSHFKISRTLIYLLIIFLQHFIFSQMYLFHNTLNEPYVFSSMVSPQNTFRVSRCNWVYLGFLIQLSFIHSLLPEKTICIIRRNKYVAYWFKLYGTISGEEKGRILYKVCHWALNNTNNKNKLFFIKFCKYVREC